MNRLTFDDAPLRPASLAERLERRAMLDGLRWRVFTEWVATGRAEMQRSRMRKRYQKRAHKERVRDSVRLKAIRGDVARGVPMADVLALYGVTEAEYWRAMAAGAE